MLRSQLSDAFSRLAAVARRNEWAIGEVQNITPTQADVLRLLKQHSGGLGVKLLAEKLAVTQPTASDAVAALVRKGLVQKEKGIEDRRAVILFLTVAGRRVCEGLESGFDDIVNLMSPEDQRVLMGVASRTILGLQRAGKIPIQHMCLTCRYFQKSIHDSDEKPHHCKLVDSPLGEGDLRVHCPEHELEGRFQA